MCPSPCVRNTHSHAFPSARFRDTVGKNRPLILKIYSTQHNPGLACESYKSLKKKKKTERERGRGGRERTGRGRKRGEQTCLENKNTAHFSWFSTILKERKTKSEPIPLVIRNAADLHTACSQPLRAPTVYLPCFTCTAPCPPSSSNRTEQRIEK